MEKQKLASKKRTITGKKVKKLRKEGILPANIYGKNIKSQAVSVDLKEFQKVFEKAKETTIIDLKIEGEEKPRPVLIHNPQFHSVTGLPLHVDFYQVSLKEKIKASIPLLFMGESPAVANKEGMLLTLLNEVEVECLPSDLPEKIKVDVSSLKKVEDELKVKDLKVDKTKIEILTDQNLGVCRIEPLITEEVKKEMEAEAAAKAAAEAEKAAAGVAGAPTEAVKTTSQSAVEGKPEEKKKEEEKK